MKHLTLASLLILINQTFSSVVQLNDTVFEIYTKESPVSLVAFTAYWCIHCYPLKIELERAAVNLSDDKKKGFFHMDCERRTESLKTCQKYNIRSYPTLLAFKHGEYHEKYTGNRKKSEIVAYMQAEMSSTKSLISCPMLLLSCAFCAMFFFKFLVI